MNTKSARLLILTAVFTGFNHAAPINEHTCSTAYTETEMYECLKLQLKEADNSLNKAYKTLMTRYKEERQLNQKVKTQGEYLREAQLAWIQFRDKSCDFDTYESITGSAFGTIYTDCLLEKTQERVKYLEWYIENL